ncbi:MAG TPA: hypothetical protein DCL24_01900 [Erysipelotrichaceae bacterium]|nr:hypothetical protein [Erysipelotrichaceae bacterium]HBZ51776.1 hypothetical protein [Erysipelotrichaceae bacterium]
MFVDVRINGYKNPIGYQLDDLRVSWVVEDARGSVQKNATIEVSEDEDFKNVIFEKTGSSLSQTGEPLNLSLKPRIRYYVRVRVETDQDDQGTGVTFFETSKMDEPFTGRWIASKEKDIFHPEFLKTFHLHKDIQSARLYISGLGMYYALLNGQQVGNEVLTPYYSDYHTEVQYQTYDITQQLQQDNTLTVMLGNGWYKGKFGLARQENNFGSRFMMIAEIHILYCDGSEEVIASDDSWLYHSSCVESSSIYDGEVINYLQNHQEKEWTKPEYISPEGRLVARYSLPVVEKDELSVKDVIITPKNETVLDFGQNFAGYVSFNTYLPKGTKIILDFGEIMQDGCFYNANYRDAKSQFVYISDGRQECVKPHFTYFGFRYVRVTGWLGSVNKDDFKGHAIYSDMPTTGHITTGHEKINRLFLNALWGQKSNFIDFPTDCPQRDERLGWTGDAQVFTGTACFNMYTAPFYHKFMHDLRVEQEKYDGIVPGVIPVLDPNGPIFSSIWGDIATFLPTELYEHYGDQTTLRQAYPMMKDWVDKITREDQKRGQQYLYNFGNQLGDWLALDGRTEQSMNGGTDEYYIGSNYYAMSVQKVANAALLLGYSDEASYYLDLYDHICQAILHEYFTPSGRLSIDTQTGYLVALYSGIYSNREKIIEGIKTRFYKDCYKLKGGFVGAPIMCKVLAENGLSDLAFYFLLNEDYPGWLHCVDLGATTIWERWNSVLDDGHLSGTMMNSLNHYAYGSVIEFLYRDVAGFKPLAPGCQKVEIAPLINQKLKHMHMTYDSPYGQWDISWQIKDNGKLHVSITIPFNASATLILPCHPKGEIGTLTSGTHVFEYMPVEDFRARYTKKTLFNDMMKDPEAMKIIERMSPLLQYFLTTGNEDFYYESLDTLMGMSYLGFKQEEVLALGHELVKLHD